MLGQSRCNRDGGDDNEASEQTNWASEMPVLIPENLPWMPATITHMTSRASGTAFRIYPLDMNVQTKLLYIHYCIACFFSSLQRTAQTTPVWVHLASGCGLRRQHVRGCIGFLLLQAPALSQAKLLDSLQKASVHAFDIQVLVHSFAARLQPCGELLACLQPGFRRNRLPLAHT